MPRKEFEDEQVVRGRTHLSTDEIPIDNFDLRSFVREESSSVREREKRLKIMGVESSRVVAKYVTPTTTKLFLRRRCRRPR